MRHAKPIALACLIFLPLPLQQVSAQTVIPHGAFAMLNQEVSCPTTSALTCYMTHLEQASKVISNLQIAGAEYFLIPSASPEEANLLADAADMHEAKILSMERWAFEEAVKDGNGQFSCESHTTKRIDKFIIPLKKEHPESFIGLQLKDEPAQPELDNLGQLVSCVRNNPATADLKVFLNLLPVNANDASLYSINAEGAGALEPTAYGVDCQGNRVSSQSKLDAMTNRYTTYAIRALDTVHPDYLSYDLYVFNPSMDNCPKAREELMTSNMSIVAQQANARGVIPITYLQNYEAAIPGSSPNSPRHASFRDLRWYAAWFYAFGGRGTANFLSHNQGTNLGLLDANNDPTNLAVEQQSVYGFTEQVQDALNSYTYIDFVAPWLAVNGGQLVGWLPSNDVMASEFANAHTDSRIIVFVTRPNAAVAPTPIGLNKWWAKVEKLNFGTGLWEITGKSTNAITIDFGDLPAAIYRLSD